MKLYEILSNKMQASGTVSFLFACAKRLGNLMF